MKKIVIGALMVLAFGIVGAIATASFTNVFTMQTVGYHDEKEVNGKDIQNIEINGSSTDIIVVPTKSNEIKVVLDGQMSESMKDKYKLTIDQSGDTLKVTAESNMFFHIGMAITDLVLEIEVPQKVYDSISVSASSGTIDIQDLQVKDFSTDVSSGDIFVEDVKVEGQFEGESSSGTLRISNTNAINYELEASSGDIIMENAVGDITADTSSGTITIDNQEVAGDILAEASSGDVMISFQKAPTSLAIDFEGSSGDGVVNIDGVNYEEKSEELIKGSIGDGEYKLFVRTSSGDFELN